MRSRLIAPIVLAAIAGVAIIATMPGVSRAQQDEPNRADLPPQPFNPQMSALMNLLIQPRHAKLGLAGKAENWPLASYEFKELQAGFIVIGKEVPRFKGLPVADLFDAALNEVQAQRHVEERREVAEVGGDDVDAQQVGGAPRRGGQRIESGAAQLAGELRRALLLGQREEHRTDPNAHVPSPGGRSAECQPDRPRFSSWGVEFPRPPPERRDATKGRNGG